MINKKTQMRMWAQTTTCHIPPEHASPSKRRSSRYTVSHNVHEHSESLMRLPKSSYTVLLVFQKPEVLFNSAFGTWKTFKMPMDAVWSLPDHGIALKGEQRQQWWHSIYGNATARATGPKAFPLKLPP